MDSSPDPSVTVAKRAVPAVAPLTPRSASVLTACPPTVGLTVSSAARWSVLMGRGSTPRTADVSSARHHGLERSAEHAAFLQTGHWKLCAAVMVHTTVKTANANATMDGPVRTAPNVVCRASTAASMRPRARVHVTPTGPAPLALSAVYSARMAVPWTSARVTVSAMQCILGHIARVVRVTCNKHAILACPQATAVSGARKPDHAAKSLVLELLPHVSGQQRPASAPRTASATCATTLRTSWLGWPSLEMPPWGPHPMC